MSDIHQEWHELRKKNGDFIRHLDGEMDKLEKKKKLLDEQKEQIFYDPVTCTYFKADPEEIQKKFESMRKDLMYKSESIAKMTADYRALCVENEDLKRQLAGAKAQCENTVENRLKISELSQTVINLREEVKRRKDCGKKLSDAYVKVIDENANLQKQLDVIKEELADFIAMYDKAAAEAHQAKVAKDRMGYSNRCMQSKIAKQSNEIKRLTHENVGLVIDIRRHKDEIDKLKQGNWDEMEGLKNANFKLEHDNFQLKQALGTSAKDADANFDRGRIKGMEEIWYELKEAFSGRALGENQKIFGCGTVGDMLMNLSPAWFINRAEEYHEQEEKEEPVIFIGDEVEIFDTFCPDDDPHSDIGIVIAIDKDNPCFAVIGPNFEGCFDETDIQSGNVRKTGKHFDSIPLDYLA